MRSEFMGSRIYASSQPGYFEIVLNRAAKRNAIDAPMRDEIVQVLQSLTIHEQTMRIGLVGAGPSFSSGGDLDEFSSHNPVANYVIRLSRALPLVISKIASRLTVGAHGPCIGAGVEIAAFAHRVVASECATFALPELRMGLTPGMGGLMSVPRRIGRGRALEWLLSGGREIDAATALDWGLVDQIVPRLELLAAVRSPSNVEPTQPLCLALKKREAK